MSQCPKEVSKLLMIRKLGFSPFYFLSESVFRRWTPFLANGEDYVFNNIFGLVMHQMICEVLTYFLWHGPGHITV